MRPTLTAIFFYINLASTKLDPLNCLNSSWHRLTRCWKHSPEHFWHYSITQLLQICCASHAHLWWESTTSQRWHIGLRYGNCGGRLSHSRNQFELFDMACYPVGHSFQKMGTLWLWREGHGQQLYTARLSWYYGTQSVPSKHSHTITLWPASSTIYTRWDGCMLSNLEPLIITGNKFWPYDLAEIEPHHTSNVFSICDFQILLSLLKL